MPKKSENFPPIDAKSLAILRQLTAFRLHDTPTQVGDRLAMGVLQKIFGASWCKKYITNSRDGFLRDDRSSNAKHEQQRMRRIALAEMLYNLQDVQGFRSCLVKLKGGDIEPTYAVLEMARMFRCKALDGKMHFRFVTESGIPRRDYDFALKFSDGVHVRAEAKCKVEETEITLKKIEKSLSKAKSQLPIRAPGMIFVKIPRAWVGDESLVTKIEKLADRFLARSPSIVSVKYYTAEIGYQEEGPFYNTWELVGFIERNNRTHQFRKLRDRNWQMFPNQPNAPVVRRNHNGLPPDWVRLYSEMGLAVVQGGIS